MLSIRKELDYEISQLKLVASWNRVLQNDIVALGTQLFTGLAAQASKESIDTSKYMSRIAMATLLYLPATFVSTVSAVSTPLR